MYRAETYALVPVFVRFDLLDSREKTLAAAAVGGGSPLMESRDADLVRH